MVGFYVVFEYVVWVDDILVVLGLDRILFVIIFIVINF